jgi:hypothetical protein
MRIAAELLVNARSSYLTRNPLDSKCNLHCYISIKEKNELKLMELSSTLILVNYYEYFHPAASFVPILKLLLPYKV